MDDDDLAFKEKQREEQKKLEGKNRVENSKKTLKFSFQRQRKKQVEKVR